MSVREYIGARYIPLFANPIEWDANTAYEPLTVVTYGGNSYTSRQYVPVGIDIADTNFWALTGNYNAQIEQYRQEVSGFNTRISNVETDMEEIKPSVDNFNYIKSESQKFYGLRNNQNPEGLISIAETYMDNNDKLFYGDHSYLGKKKDGDNWVFKPVPGIVDGNNVKFPMSCSTLVMSALLGIGYENSRMGNNTGSITISGNEATLVGGVNNSYAGSKFMSENTNSEAAVKYGSDEGTLHSWQLAEYLNDLGYLYRLESINDLRPGDILFYENWTGQEEHWQNINHVEIFIGFNTTTTGTNLISISGEKDQQTNIYAQFVPRPINGTMVSTLKWFARFDSPFIPVYNHFEGVNTTVNITNNSFHTVRIKNESVPLRKNKAYTLIFKLSESSKDYLPLHFNVYLYNGTSTYQSPLAFFYVDNVFNEIAPNTYACVVRTTNIDDAIAISYQQVENKETDYYVEWIALYDGVVSW